MQNQTINPVVKNNRIEYLDILRGIAIMFIFTANIPFFSGLWFVNADSNLREINWATDEIFNYIMYVLVDGKFYSIFSLLFGIGCTIQFNNVTSHNKAFARFFRRRMFWLLVFGLIHLFLLWPGDILTLYALLGFFLIWFIKKSNKTLLVTAIILILAPIVNWAFIYFTGIFYPGTYFQLSTNIYQHFGMPVIEMNGHLQPNIVAFLTNTNLPDFFKMSLGNAFIRIGMILEEGRIFKVFGIFLIGIWAGRKILNENLLNNIPFLRKSLLIGILLGLPMNFIRGYIEFFSVKNVSLEILHILTYAFGTVPLAMAFAAGIALLYKRKVSFLNWFKPVGKMALTCYLTQTIISIIIFYGFGFNQTGKYGFTIVMLIALTIFVLQVILSKLWLNYFKFGPMEWIWRQLTYGKKLTLKR